MKRQPGKSVQQIAADLRREKRTSPDWARRRGQIVRRHARRDWHGKPMKCEVSPVVADPRMDQHAGKVIYDSLEIAELAARELEAAGAPKQWALPCPRSKRGHHHLTSKDPATYTVWHDTSRQR